MAIQVNGCLTCGFKQVNSDAQRYRLRMVALGRYSAKITPCVCRFWKIRYAYCAFARFASRYAPLGFTVDESTTKLTSQMRASWVILSLSEYGQRRQKAFNVGWSDIYFETFYQLNVLDVIMPNCIKHRMIILANRQWCYLACEWRESNKRTTSWSLFCGNLFLSLDQQINSQNHWAFRILPRFKGTKNAERLGLFIVEHLMN